MVSVVVKPPLRSNSTDVSVPRAELNFGNDKVSFQSVSVAGMGVVVVNGPLMLPWAKEAATAMTTAVSIATRSNFRCLTRFLVTEKSLFRLLGAEAEFPGHCLPPNTTPEPLSTLPLTSIGRRRSIPDMENRRNLQNASKVGRKQGSRASFQPLGG